MRTYYHISPVSNREQIKAQGLKAGMSSMWPEMEEQPAAIYLWTDHPQAVNWGFHVDSQIDEAQDLWVIRTSDLDTQPDYLLIESYPDYSSSCYSFGNIAPEYLELEQTIENPKFVDFC